MSGASPMTEVQYMVLPNREDPYLLARVRWPDIAQGLSVGRPQWQNDPGLFDLPYDPSSVIVTATEAEAIAARWGAAPYPDAADYVPSLIRRMPANWSNLVPAEKHAWSLEFALGRRRSRSRLGRKQVADRSLQPATVVPVRRISDRVGRPVGKLAVPRQFVPNPEVTVPGSEVASETAAATAERRSHGRVQVCGQAQITWAQRTIFASLVNASEGGVHCVVSDARSLAGLGNRIDEPLVLQDDVTRSRIILRAPSGVAWRKEIGAGAELGVAFGELADGQIQQVKRFLTTVSTEPRA